jgi:hypothetical protein
MPDDGPQLQVGDALTANLRRTEDPLWGDVRHIVQGVMRDMNAMVITECHPRCTVGTFHYGPCKAVEILDG